MNKATSTLIAAVAALTLSGGAYAQNNTLATPSTVSPAANATSGYGTPGVTNSDSGMGAGSPNRACRIARIIARRPSPTLPEVTTRWRLRRQRRRLANNSIRHLS